MPVIVVGVKGEHHERIAQQRSMAITQPGVAEQGDPVSSTYVRIRHSPSDALIADGPLGWGITPFEGNFYISRKYLVTDGFRINGLPGLCIYKFLYVWLNFFQPDGTVTRNLGWKYWLPNPLLPFIWFRVAVPAVHPEISVERYQKAD